MNYFKNIKTIKEMKKVYYQNALRLHPDKSTGNLEEFKVLQNQYEALNKKLLETGEIKTEEQKKKTAKDINDNIDLMKTINEIIKNIPEELILNIRGSWIWIDCNKNNTFPIKEKLKGIGFRFSRNKKSWYHGNLSGKTRKGRYSLKKIKEYYGDEEVIKEGKKLIK